jgi:DEAD/DEAH box helicase domain-containing protein
MTAEALSLLEEEGSVRLRAGRWYWSDEGYPSEAISLRSATADNVVIVDVTGGSRKVIGEMDRPSAKELLFDNAVYMHLGQQYLVTSLDIANRLCTVERRSLEYWTDSIVKTDLEVLTEDERGWAGSPGALPGPFAYSLGDVLVRSQAEKFKKLRFHTHENVGYGEIHLPAEEMQTRALSLLFPRGRPAGDYLAALDPSRAAVVLVGSAKLFKSLAPAFVLCDAGDLGVSERVKDQHFLEPAIHLYDRYPGGTGLAEALTAQLPELARAALERLSGCDCRFGCPSCVGVDLEPEGAPMVGAPMEGALEESAFGAHRFLGPKKLVGEFLALCVADTCEANGEARREVRGASRGLPVEG